MLHISSYIYIVHLCIYIWYDMIWSDMIWYDMIWYDMIWYDMIWIWYVICDIWYMIYDIWYMIYDIWYDMHICMYNVYRVPKFSCASNKLVYMPYVDICWSLGHPLFWGFPHQGSCFTGLHLHLLWQPGLRLLAALLLGTDGFTSAGGCESR